MNVLSLFDGMSCGQLALQRGGHKVEHYFASEINEAAMKITRHNFPNTIQLGDVSKLHYTNNRFELQMMFDSWIELPEVKIDLLIGGSPCQGLSQAGLGRKFEDQRSKLFYEYVRILNQIRKYNPDVKFLLENVKMDKYSEHEISRLLGVKPIHLNSKLVSAQNRLRLYWTNIRVVDLPVDKKIFLKDVLEHGVTDRAKSFCIDANYFKGGSVKMYREKARRQIVLQQSEKRLVPIVDTEQESFEYKDFRMLTVKECLRLQTIPDDYIPEGLVSKSAAFACIGNGWTVDIIVHLFKHL